MLWLSVALVLRAASVPLEVPPAKAVSLEEALALARAQHPALEASRQRVAAAQAEVDAVSALWLPTAGLAAELVGATANNSTATVLSTPAVDLPRIGSTKVTAAPDFAPSATSLVAVGLRQLVWDFGRQGAQGKVAQAQAAAEQARLSRTALGLDFDVTRAFQAVLAARAVLEASEQAYVRVVTHRDFAKVAVDAQLRPPIEFTRAEADVSRAELGRLRALSAVTAARLQLAAAVGGAELQLDAQGALRPPEPPPSLEQARAAALASEPVLAEATAAAEAQRSQAELQRALSRPTLSATAALSGRNGGAAPSSGTGPTGAGFLPLVPNYSLGLVLTWPLLDVPQGRRAQAAEARGEASDGEVRALALAVGQAASLAAERARLALESLAPLQRAAEASRANAAQAEARFKGGLGTSLELADAEALRTEAEIAVVLGTYEAVVARAALDRVMARETR